MCLTLLGGAVQSLPFRNAVLGQTPHGGLFVGQTYFAMYLSYHFLSVRVAILALMIRVDAPLPPVLFVHAMQ
jgi:hypothetical protein